MFNQCRILECIKNADRDSATKIIERATQNGRSAEDIYDQFLDWSIKEIFDIDECDPEIELKASSTIFPAAYQIYLLGVADGILLSQTEE